METTGGLRIYSWNINGIRTLDMTSVLSELGHPSILSVQETKISKDQLDAKKVFIGEYSSYFAFSRNKTGYSGVGAYCSKDFTPIKVEDCLSGMVRSPKLKEEDWIQSDFEIFEDEKAHAKFGDNDGRTLISQHMVQTETGEKKLLTIFNVYCPRLRDDPEDNVNNREFKMAFHLILERRAKSLVKDGSFVLILGDLNICPSAFDRSEIEEDRNQFTQTDFTDWINDIISEGGFVDTFRHIHPNREKAFTCWNTKTNARQNNHGSRIDFILADKELVKYLESADIHPDVLGSDHCPISAQFHTLLPIPIDKLPPLATKNYPEYQQKNMRDFLIKSSGPTASESIPLKDTLPSSNTVNASPSSSTSTGPNQGAANQSQSSKKRGAPSGSKPKQLSLTNFFMKKQKLDDGDSGEIEGGNSQGNGKGSEKLSQEEREKGWIDVKSGSIFKEVNSDASKAWKTLFKSPEIPVCSGHKEPCTLKTVTKKGANKGRKFWACPRGAGPPSDPNSNCNFFQWSKGN